MPDGAYQFATILRPRRNRSKRRASRFDWIATIILLIGLLAAICEAF
ncbi:MAG: hypothetical protein WBQ94_04170 [Terracidiphilus sp.]